MQDYRQASNVKSSSCAWQGCKNLGEFPAPVSPHQLEIRVHYCKEHIRQYNKNWNYFRNMDNQQVNDFMVASLHGHRPTRKVNIDPVYYNEEIFRQKIREEFGFKQKDGATNVQKNKDREALAIFNLSPPVDWKMIRKKYKELAKIYHPDINKNVSDEKLKLINQAYMVLKRIYEK